MGQFFERILIQDKGVACSKTIHSGIPKAAQRLGYAGCEQGKGVPVHVKLYPDSEWYDIESPFLESASETAAQFMEAFREEASVPILMLQCVDSDFVACHLWDKTNGTDTVACLGEPYEPLGEPDYEAWGKACKKKWKCKTAQFQEVFEAEYIFAEDGLWPLSKMLHFAPAVLDDSDEHAYTMTFWFLPADEAAAPDRPRTLIEKAADFMEEEYAQLLTEKGFRRFAGYALRWHKVVGEAGNEVLLSIVITTWHGFQFALFYGWQSLYCPLILSDKYYPYHDDPSYWVDANDAFSRKRGWNPCVIKGTSENGGIDHVFALDDPEMLRPYIDELILPELDAIRDFQSCHEAFLRSFKEAPSVTRLWIESILCGDEKTSQECFEDWKNFSEDHKDQAWVDKWYANELSMMKAYETGGLTACREWLEKKVYRKNLTKLQKAGVI